MKIKFQRLYRININKKQQQDTYMRLSIIFFICLFTSLLAHASSPDSLKYPIKDRNGDFVTDPVNNSVDLDDPANIVKTVEYDPETKLYVVRETVGGFAVRPPQYLTYDEYVKYIEQQQKNEFVKGRNNGAELVERKGIVAPINTKNKTLDRLFGGLTVDIRPSGNIELTLGGNSTKIANPTLPQRVQKTGGFDFDMNINMNVLGKIGNKLQLNLNYNTQGGFSFNNDFNNLIKLNYVGEEDDIVQEVAAGTVSLPLNTQLITGAQALFGFKTKLRFGRFTVSALLSQQKSKKESITLDNGVQVQKFELAADKYDVNRHYFLSQNFRSNFDFALSTIPNIRSVVQINRVEVWVTNRNGATLNVRDVVALADLGEVNPFSPEISSNPANQLPDNNSNNLYSKLTGGDPTLADNRRGIDEVIPFLKDELGLQPIQDYEKIYARKLSPTDFTFDPVLGFISLNQTLNPNEVLGVAYEYTYNGQRYQVGEFSSQVVGDTLAVSKVLYLKMLKSTSARPQLPIWNLMMKNIYSIGGFQISNEDFYLDLYYNDPGNGLKRYLPEGNIKGKQLIRLLNLDNTNNQRDPQPDGVFDFIPDLTIKVNNGRIMFPCLEPFGSYLQSKFEQYGDNDIAPNYIYNQLYDSTQTIAQQFPELNRFVIKGSYKSSAGGDIQLGAFNLPQGSVTVTAGGIKLTEGLDYTVDYSLGRVKIINDAITKSGNQVKVDFENNALFGFQTKALYGTRMDYRVSEKLNIGATLMHLSERPFTQKVNIGEDPTRNTIFGADIKYNTDLPWLTKALDKLPIYATKDMSTLTFNGEVARLQPGHSKMIGKDGVIYLDDFEGTNSGFDVRLPAQNWKLASTPRGARDANGNFIFTEANNYDSTYNFNRAKLSWYTIDPLFVQDNSTLTPQYIKDNPVDFINHYTRQVQQTEVFPNKVVQNFQGPIPTLDLHFNPKIRGPYNFEATPFGTPISAGIDDSGYLNNPKSRWGGIMRNIDNTDFEQSNVEYIEFWMLDPFIDNNSINRRGELIFNLGTISEDILHDSRMLYENGLSCDPNKNDQTSMGQVPRIAPIVNAFDNDPATRACQDVGFDGLSNDQEISRYTNFITQLRSTVTSNTALVDQLALDPANDDYKYYRDASYDDINAKIIDHYNGFNNVQGNSPIVDANQQFSNAATNIPDIEDLNRDNSINENEEYYQYRVPIFPGMNETNNKYIVSKVENSAITYKFNGQDIPLDPYTWYQFRIPIREYDERVGDIQDFRSIQTLRMYATNFEKEITMRLAKLELIRNQWRVYNNDLKRPGDVIPIDPDNPTSFFQTSVNIEENSEKEPVNYVIPPGIYREVGPGQTATNGIAQNEQAISVKACNLQDGDARALFKNVNLDLRNYKTLKMFLHAEEAGPTVTDGDITSFLRIGSDYNTNYYQYEIPLKVTPAGTYDNKVDADRLKVWPEENNVDLSLDAFIKLKQERNANGVPLSVPYSTVDDKGRILTIVGNPDLGLSATVMLGVKNPAQNSKYNPRDVSDDGAAKCVEVWFNELRTNGLAEGGGTATLASLNLKMADLANVAVSTRYHSIGFGQIEQKVDQRYRDEYVDYDVAGNVEVGKFFPKKAGIRIPFYGTYAQKFSTPQYDPYMLDVKSKDNIANIKNVFGADSANGYKKQIQTIETRRGFNFTNVRIVPDSKSKKVWPWSLGNFTFTYAFTEQYKSDPFMEYNGIKNHTGSFGYNYSPQPWFLFPFKKAIKSKSKWFDIIKDINFNIVPTTLSFNTEIRRRFGEQRLRVIGEEDFPIAPTYNKYFVWDRDYAFRWSPFKSLNIDYTATNNARIDEPDGKIDTKEEKKEIWDNVLKFGRNTNFNQSLNASYNLPINKIPLLDWVQVRGSYAANYTWTAAPQVRNDEGKMVQNTLGNIISNSQNISTSGDFNIKRLYDKVPFLKTYNNPNPNQGDSKKRKTFNDAQKKAKDKLKADLLKAQKELNKNKSEIKDIKADEKLSNDEKKPLIKALKIKIKATKKSIRKIKKDISEKQPSEKPGVALLIQPLLMLKKVSVTYSENRSTTVTGFMQTPKYLGVSGINSPGYDFAFGKQPGMTPFTEMDANERNAWLDKAATNGWISNDTFLNRPFLQTYQQSLNIKANLEPWRDFKIDLEWNKSYTVNHQQFFKKETGDGDFEHLFPKDMGTYTITTAPIGTAFDKLNNDYTSKLYNEFEKNRITISDRFSKENPNAAPTDFVQPDGSIIQGYKEGYGPKSQDVLIPSFLAAYQGKNANTVNLNPFKSLPLPNWRFTYNGLTNFAWAKKVFTSFSLTHSYNSTMSINSFETNLQYLGEGYTNSKLKDTLSNNYFSQYRMPNIILNESFQPLIGVRMTFKNTLTIDFDYKRSRIMTMSFTDYQLNEIKSETFTFGAGYKLKGLKFSLFKIKGKPFKLENDFNFRFDFSIRDNVTVSHRIDQNSHIPTVGSKVISISPSIDYTVSKRVNVRLFFDYNRTLPRTSASFPITNMQGGIKLRLSLNPN